MVIAVLGLPAIDAIAKLLSDTLPAGEVAWARFFFQCLLLAPFVVRGRRRRRPHHLVIHSLRGVFLAATTVFIFAALKWMPIADAIAIFFLEPLIVTLLSVLFLNERIGWRRVLASVVGFAGSLIVIRPSYDMFGVVAVLPLAAAVCFAIYLVLTRYWAHRGDDPVMMQFHSGLAGLLFLSAALLVGSLAEIPVFNPVWPTALEWSLLALSGMIATVGHLMIVMACRNAEAAMLAPFQYLEIVSATAFGFWLFADFPDEVTWLGILIIVGSGLYTFRRKRLLSTPTNRRGKRISRTI